MVKYFPSSFRLKKLMKEPFFFVVFIGSIITLYLLLVQIRIGVPYYDVFNYLNNALYFSGKGVGNVLFLPPLIPFFTSLIFRMGYISPNVIFIIDAFIFIGGIIGFYILLRERFSPISSFAGVMIFLSFPLILAWAVSGGIDIPAVSFSIWAVYSLVKGVKKDSRWLYLVFPFYFLALLTRYTAVLMIFPLVLYLIFQHKRVEKLKRIILGGLIPLIIFLPILLYFSLQTDIITPLFNLLYSTVFISSTVIPDVAYNPYQWHYLENIMKYISICPLPGKYQELLNPSQTMASIFSYFLIIISLIGLLVQIYSFFHEKIFKSSDYKFKYKNKILLALIGLLIIVLVITWSKFTYLLSEILVFSILYLIYYYFQDYTSDYLQLDLLFISWFLSYFIFHSILPIKVDRYFVTMTPALAYFLLLGLTGFYKQIKVSFKYLNIKSGIYYVIISILLLSLSVVAYADHTPKRVFVYQIEEASDWLMEYDPNYQDKIIYSDYAPAVGWYLKKEVATAAPRDTGDPMIFSQILKDRGVYYYIDTLSDPKLNLTGFQIIKRIGIVAIYQRI